MVSIFFLILVLVTGRAQMSQPSHHHRLIPHLDDHSSDCCDEVFLAMSKTWKNFGDRMVSCGLFGSLPLP